MAETKPTGAKKHITGARIAQEIKQYKKDALISPLYTVCCVILEILIPYLTASIIDKGIAVGNMAHVAKIGALMAVMERTKVVTRPLRKLSLMRGRVTEVKTLPLPAPRS